MCRMLMGRAFSIAMVAFMVAGGMVGLAVRMADAGTGNHVLQDTTPPEVWGRTVIYPAGQDYAKKNDVIQIRLYAKDNESSVSSATYDLTPWRGPANQPLYDDGLHLDRYANDGYYSSGMITVTSGERCSYDWIPVTVVNPDGYAYVTSVTVAVDSALPKVKNVSLEYPPGQNAVKTGDRFRVIANATDFCKPSIDVVFDTDDSGSMSWNDPNDLRVQAICNFVQKFMTYPDRGTGVFFYGTGNPELFPRGPTDRHLHDNYAQICSDAQTVQSSGGTDGWPSLDLSMNEMLNYGDPSKNRTIILLTDGQFNVGTNSSSTIINGPNGCQQQKITIYTVGLGSGVDEAMLKWLARQCNGQYFFAQNASVLDQIYQIIGGLIKRLPVPYGVDHVWADTKAFGGKPSEEMYDDGMHGDGAPADSYYAGDVLVLTKNTGEFTVPVTAYDRAGNFFTNSSLKVKIDNLPPVISSVSVKYASGTKAKDGDAVTISATVTDTGIVSGVRDVYVDASAFGGGKWVKMAGSGGQNTSPPIKVYTLGGTGAYPFTVYAYDIAGNVATKDGVVEVDNQDPKVKIYGLAQNEVISGTYLFAASAFDAARVTMEIAGNTNINQDMEYDQKSKLWKVSVDTESALPDGDYTIKVTAYDRYGDTDSAGPMQFKVDNNPPQLAFSPDIRDGEFMEGKQTLTTWVTYSDGPFTPRVETSIDGLGWTNLAKSPIWDTGNAMDGPHTVTFRATDLAGFQTTVSLMVRVDNHAPRLEMFQAPAEDEPLTGEVEFRIDATDAMGIHEVNFTLEGPGKKVEFLPVKLEKGADGYYYHSIDARTLELDGTYRYTVRTIDIPGANGRRPYIDPVNHEVSLTGKFIVDNTAPTIMEIDVDDGYNHTKELNKTGLKILRGLIYINVSVADLPGQGAKSGEQAGFRIAYVRIDGGPWRELNETNVTGMYQYQWRTGKMDNGPHLVEVKALDNLGNAAYGSMTVYVDNPDYTSGALAIVGISSFFVLLTAFALFHWRKYKAIASSTPAGYETLSREQVMQAQAEFQPGEGDIRW